MNALTMSLADGYTVFRRNLIKIRRVPDILVFATLSPIMFIVLFGFIFGSAIDIPGVGYRQFLLPGIFVQTVVFGATFTGVSLAEDLQKGMIDRFRTLPMSRSAVVVGRTAADVGINAITLVIMALTGLAIGWRVHTSVLQAIGAFALLLLFAYSFSWVMAAVGLAARTPEVVQNSSFIVIFPITFVADTFVPQNNLPTVIRTLSEWNPVSAVAAACRELFGNTSPAFPAPDVWSMQHPVLYTLIWVVAILAVFVPLSIRQYQRAATR